jgi:glucose/arabinose dehydrogenase
LSIRMTSSLVILALAFCCAAGADARGTATVTKSTGVVRTYQNVRIHLLGTSSLRVVSADGQGSLTIRHAACSYIGDLRRCLPFEITLDQHGAKRLIDLERGTLYVNTTDGALTMPHSTVQVPPHSIVLGLQTLRGTVISVSGQVDGGPQ